MRATDVVNLGVAARARAAPAMSRSPRSRPALDQSASEPAVAGRVAAGRRALMEQLSAEQADRTDPQQAATRHTQRLLSAADYRRRRRDCSRPEVRCCRAAIQTDCWPVRLGRLF